jgi:hypothetical protein
MPHAAARSPGQVVAAWARRCRTADAGSGAELKAAQERGEVGAQGRRSDIVRGADEVTPAISEIGSPRQRAAEMKKLAKAGTAAIRAAPTDRAKP